MKFKNQIIQGDTFQALKQLPNDVFDTIITSPPYWGLRDYGVGGQIGLEPTLEEYLGKMLAVMKELKRVLKSTGVLFLNHGDCYGTGAGADKRPGIKQATNVGTVKKKPTKGFQKCLLLQNYRLILKMIDEQGWILRNSIIWSKPNAMPSSVKDRFANKYEPVFMLVKKKKYWFDLDAVRKPYAEPMNRWGGDYFNYRVRDAEKKQGQPQFQVSEKEKKNYPKKIQAESFKRSRNMRPDKAGKNPGDLWQIPTQPFPMRDFGEHFATFPEKLIEPMILSSCPKEICKKCGKARVRITKPTEEYAENLGTWTEDTDKSKKLRGEIGFQANTKKVSLTVQYKTIGWTDCGCNAGWEAGICLDPFIGSGTVAVVAKRLGRNYCGIELNKDYIKMAKQRIRGQIRAML